MTMQMHIFNIFLLLVVVFVLHQFCNRRPNYHPRFSDVHFLGDNEGFPVDDPADVEVLAIVPFGFRGKDKALHEEGSVLSLPSCAHQFVDIVFAGVSVSGFAFPSDSPA